MLFIDARGIYTQVDRAHREFTDSQIAFLAALVRLYRGDDLEGYTFDATGLNLTDIQIPRKLPPQTAIRTRNTSTFPASAR